MRPSPIVSPGLGLPPPRAAGTEFLPPATHGRQEALRKYGDAHQAYPTRHTARSEAGQTMIFMIMVLIILAVVIVWFFDVHSVLQLKARTQNAGDAAALAAARWQGISLNMVGELNIFQALAISRGDMGAAAQLVEVQKRICYTGPMVGLLASQQAAKNNGIYCNPEYTSNLMAHANRVMSYYAENTNYYRESYFGAWWEYGPMLSNIAAEGVAAGPDNTRYFTDSTADNNWLLSLNFYEAVAGSDWCWFYWNGLSILQSYSDFQYWPDLPSAQPSPNTCNSEVFGLGLVPVTSVLPGGADTVERMNSLISEYALSQETISGAITGAVCTWFGYDQNAWDTWSALAGSNNFPIISDIKPEYDYSGADAVVRVEAAADPRMPAAFPGLKPFLIRSSSSAERLTQGASAGAVTWTAAAKPFGYLTVDEVKVRPYAYTIVLPSFFSVRLIPVDSASGSNLGAYNIDWRRHIQDHLPLYMQSGQAGLEADCWYCRQLQTWGDPVFRQQGIDWLNDPGHTCRRTIGGGPGGSDGGTRRGH